jgi:MFS family permease
LKGLPNLSAARLNPLVIVALAGISIPLLMLSTEFVLIYFNPEYNPIIESISALGLKPLGWVQSLSFLIIGLLIEVFTFGLYFGIRRRRGFGISVTLLALFGFGLLLIGAFRTQPPGSPPTVEGVIHSATARFIFALFPIASFSIAPSLRADRRWRALSIYTVTAGAVGSMLIICWIYLSSRINWFGLCERLLVANAVIWLEVTSINLLRLSLHQSSEGQTAERAN